ncbi:MAG: DNA mismatch repair endonuclease MutL [Candidatus Peregrinibacteria bacterium]|nr:DNA mismatch repair endonuclease MutL [Candidatus Peregrinibacteria bacterium]MDZ4244424.1 DNA mismatch repair endonuclease MutL [Candidatus Gracilibacteria bacterium]
MNKIHILPDNLVNQIAAGEVVERPSSVVKELIENSIDANASTITVEVEAGGKKLIRITDDGYGISPEDLPFAFERHATSKIGTEEDLVKISTMGFRGEAIASIGSVAKMSIASRTYSNTGSILVCEGGNLTDIEPYGMPEGTRVTVRNLFFNTPARMKFMKTDQTEFNYITQYVTEVALIHPQLHLKLVHDGRLIAEYTPAANSLERMTQVFGNTIAKELLTIQYLADDLKISGFIGKPGIARSSRSSQYLFVNNRPVKNATVSAAVQKAFHSLLPHGKFPFFVININLPFEKVDVNVHPRKLEVRFLYQSELFQVVTASVKKALETNSLSPEFSGEVRSYWKTEKLFSTSNASDKPTQASVNAALKFTETMLDYDTLQKPRMHQPIIHHYEENDTIQTTKTSLTPICQIANSYILAHGEEGLVIIDQHAAHERVLYNYFLKRAQDRQDTQNNNGNSDVETQRLLVPIDLELSISEVQLLEQNLDMLSGIGFEIEPFGGNIFHVHAVPTALIKSDIQKVILEVIDDLKNNDPKKLKEPQHAAICYMACRGAIKFGDPLTPEEMISLIRQMDEQDQKYTCPHGRPTMLNLTFAELEKRFGRK